MPLAIHPRLAWQLVDGEALVVDVVEGKTLGLNPVGSLIWSLLPEHDPEAIAAAVAEVFEVDLATAREDVAGFLATLRAKGLLVEQPT